MMTIDLKIENNIAEKVTVTKSGHVRLVCNNTVCYSQPVLAYQYNGKLWDRYQCYVAFTPDPCPKTFEEWLDS
jgi:hypothetical protein